MDRVSISLFNILASDIKILTYTLLTVLSWHHINKEIYIVTWFIKCFHFTFFFYTFVLHKNTDSQATVMSSGEGNGLAFELRVGLISLGISLCTILSAITGWLSSQLSFSPLLSWNGMA